MIRECDFSDILNEVLDSTTGTLTEAHIQPVDAAEADHVTEHQADHSDDHPATHSTDHSTEHAAPTATPQSAPSPASHPTQPQASVVLVTFQFIPHS